MEKLMRCSVCGYTTQESQVGEKCTKCGAPREKFIELTDEQAQKIYNSDITNDIHMEIINLAMAIEDLALEGEEINLDPGCTAIFKRVKDEMWTIKQLCKAELETHMKKGKW